MGQNSLSMTDMISALLASARKGFWAKVHGAASLVRPRDGGGRRGQACHGGLHDFRTEDFRWNTPGHSSPDEAGASFNATALSHDPRPEVCDWRWAVAGLTGPLSQGRAALSRRSAFQRNERNRVPAPTRACGDPRAAGWSGAERQRVPALVNGSCMIPSLANLASELQTAPGQSRQPWMVL